MFKKIKRYIKNPYVALGDDMIQHYPQLMSDRFYISTMWRIMMGYELNWCNLRTYNEKLQWAKLYNRNPLYTTLVDKYRVKDWVAEKIGKEYIIPTLAKYDSVDEIDIESLPNQFVLKCNHDSGSVFVCKDKATFDFEAVMEKLRNNLKRDFSKIGREWPYKNVKRCIIAEQYMKDESSADLPAYKFFCFNGEPVIIQSIQNDKLPNETVDFFDTQWNLLDCKQIYPNSDKPLTKPTQLTEMVELARKLSQWEKGHVRVDLYLINDKIYFSEFTFFNEAGLGEFVPAEWDEKLGSLFILPNK